jgi:ubiquinone/menaquinone biosynthesis C-methylase UbiE
MQSNNNVKNIRNIIIKQSIGNKNKWINSLEDRKKEEVLLHDKLRDSDFKKNVSSEEIKKYFSNTKIIDGFSKDGDTLFSNNQLYFDREYLIKNSIAGLSDIYFNHRIAEISNDSIILDMACGYGRESIIAAHHNAKLVVGIDLSPNSIEEANKLAKNNDLQNVIFSVADCEKLYFENNTFDYVICARMLHHVKFEETIKEAHRVLKEHGRVICIEALGINPLLNMYRKMTPAQRTHWEASNILTFKHIKIAKKYFKIGPIQFWHILSPLAKFSKYILPLANFLDKYLLTKIPFFNRLSWIFTFELIKKNNY